MRTKKVELNEKVRSMAFRTTLIFRKTPVFLGRGVVPVLVEGRLLGLVPGTRLGVVG